MRRHKQGKSKNTLVRQTRILKSFPVNHVVGGGEGRAGEKRHGDEQNGAKM